MNRIFLTPLIGLFTLTLSCTSYSMVCNGNLEKSAPDERFVVNDNGSATDKLTNLTWSRCNGGQVWDGEKCTGESGLFTWGEALIAASEFSLNGSDSWRLPNMKELMTILESNCYDPSINASIFFVEDELRSYWSSTPTKFNDGSAWMVIFGYGNTNDLGKSAELHVRYVKN